VTYPPIDPDETGLLDTGDGNLIYWETSGNPDGLPALVVHGGPGGSTSPGARRGDPERHWIIQFDQRNCGQSRPHASDPAADMSLNTTEHLIRDMEQLREHLGVEKWILRGASWGVTLSLAYAERYPERVAGLALASITTGRRSELDWLYRGVGRVFPEAWARFRVCAHYFAHDCFLEDGVLIREAGRLAGIPGYLVHGRNDLGGPVVTAWELARAWPDAEFVVIEDSGHTGSPSFGETVRAARGRLYSAATSQPEIAS
jgi:pimeloyl-ACP methyl ester carboxylesterase